MKIDFSRPVILLIGGSNGCGKTTVAEKMVNDLAIEYLGADQIAYLLNPQNVDVAAVQAGKVFIKRIKDRVANRQSLIVESTLSGKTLSNHLRTAKMKGYQVFVMYIYLENVELSLKRIQSRVKAGGHDVPEIDVRRRFLRSRIGFWHNYRLIADSWELYYNSPDAKALNEIQIIAAGEEVEDGEDLFEQITVIDKDQYNAFLRSFGESDEAD